MPDVAKPGPGLFRRPSPPVSGSGATGATGEVKAESRPAPGASPRSGAGQQRRSRDHDGSASVRERSASTTVGGHELLRRGLRDLPIGDCSHIGLAWQRLLGQDKAGNERAHHDHVAAVAQLKVPEEYVSALARWGRLVGRKDTDSAAATWRRTLPGTAHVIVETTGPLAVGLSTASPIDIGCSLHHTYGVPYLPGSALKGLARRALGLMAFEGGETARDLTARKVFGADDSEVAGYITFWDGWLDATAGDCPLRRDVITVHHQDYYRNSGKTPPTDFDSPNPIPFLSVEPNTMFLVAATCADSSDIGLTWAELACRLVVEGFKELGFGAKTNAGYGLGRAISESATN